MLDKDMITLKVAVQLTGKSEVTLRRMIKAGDVKSQKIKQGRYTRIHLNKNEIMNAVAKKYGHEVRSEQVRKESRLVLQEQAQSTPEIYKDMLNMMREQVRQQAEKIKEMERNIKEKDQKIDRLNEELKALLRENRHRPRGIMGYLVERIKG